jgi:O-antigen/teichoic acid export membrane protein
MSLKEKSIIGAKWTSFSAVFNVLMAISKTAIMARLLTPVDFGLMAMLQGVMVFGRPLVETGLGLAIIQARDITTKQLSTIYLLNVGLGVFVFIIMVLISPFVAEFYEEEQLTGLLILFAVSFIIGPIGAQFNVLFQKELNFSFPVKVDFISNILSFVVAVALAYYGWGVYALVYGRLARTVVNTTLIVIFGLKLHRPQFYFNLGEVKSLIKFGGFNMGERYTQLIAGNLDKISYRQVIRS